MQLLEALLFIKKFLLLSLVFRINLRGLEVSILQHMAFDARLIFSFRCREVDFDDELFAVLVVDLVWIGLRIDVEQVEAGELNAHVLSLLLRLAAHILTVDLVHPTCKLVSVPG